MVDQGGRPVEHAEVALIDQNEDNVLEDLTDTKGFRPENLSDSNGLVAVKHVRPGTYTAYARRGTRHSERTQLIVEFGATATVTVQFPPEK